MTSKKMTVDQAKECAGRSREELKDKDKEILIDIIKTLHQEIEGQNKAFAKVVKVMQENKDLKMMLSVRMKSGRKPVSKEKRQEIERLRDTGLTIRKISEQTGVSRAAVGRIVQRYDRHALKSK